MFNHIADILLIVVEGSAADSGLPAYFTDRNVIRIFLFQQFLVPDFHINGLLYSVFQGLGRLELR